MWRTLKSRLTGLDWQGARLFNFRSPSSHPEIVARIVEEFVLPAGSEARILDVGGTGYGFVGHLGRDHRHLRQRVCLVNPRGGPEIAYRDIAQVPPDAGPFDLAMMFGVMVYMDEAKLLDLFRRVNGLLRPGGAFVLADPNGATCMNNIERPLKPILGLPSVLYTPADGIRLLRAAGFVRARRRPDLNCSRHYWTVTAYRRAAKGARVGAERAA